MRATLTRQRGVFHTVNMPEKTELRVSSTFRMGK
jgi:hypothetical protein